MVVLNELVELQEPTANLVTRDDSQVPMHLQQHHFGGGVASPTLHHHMGSLGRKVNNNGAGGGARPYRLSTFRPLHGQHADLIRECIEERMTGPTYETIDPHHLSHFGYSTDYCTVSGSGCSSGSSVGRSNAGCIETILPDSRCYATGGRGHASRPGDYHPVHPHHNAIYCSNVKQLEKEDEFGILSAIFTIISLISYVIDIGTDISVCYLLYGLNDSFSLGLTFAITIIPSITVNIFSIKWLLHDNRKDKNNMGSIRRPRIGVIGWIVKILVHLLLLGPVLRYLELLWYGLESRSANKRNEKRQQRDWQMNTLPALSTLQRTNLTEGQSQAPNEPQIDYYLMMIHEDRDTALLSLLKSFIQCAPQMILQIYLVAKRKHFNTTEYVQMAAIMSSLFELSWSIASYNRALRRSTPDKRNITRMGTVLQFLWRFCTIGSRVLAIALFISEYSFWICPVAIGHWGIMTIWIMHQQTRFCDSDRGEPRACHEYLFNMVIGAIYMFCFLNVKDEPTRYKYLSYYTIVLSQNLSLIILWFMKSDPVLWYHIPALAAVLAAFWIGILFMLIYYWFLHPNGRPLWINRAARCC